MKKKKTDDLDFIDRVLATHSLAGLTADQYEGLREFQNVCFEKTDFADMKVKWATDPDNNPWIPGIAWLCAIELPEEQPQDTSVNQITVKLSSVQELQEFLATMPK